MKDAFLRAMGSALDGLGVGLCAFDSADLTVAWNATFLQFFPEHDGVIARGEPFAEHLRRFFRHRLQSADEAVIEPSVSASIIRYRTQTRPYAFDHGGERFQVSTFDMPQGGRVRLWRKIGSRPSVSAVHAGAKAPDPSDASAILETLADGIVVLDGYGRLLWANQAFLNLYNCQSTGQVLGDSLQQIFLRCWEGSREAEPVLESLSALGVYGASGQPFELELPRSKFVRVSERRTDSAGRAYFVHSDISHLRTQRAMQDEAVERYRLMAQYSNDIMLFVVGGLVTYASPAITEWLGWEAVTVVGRPLVQFCHPEDASRVVALLRSLRGRQEVDYQARVLHRLDRYVWIEARACRLPSSNATDAARFVINARGIDARKAMEDELRVAKQRLQDLAMTDGLTGLANRRRLDEALDLELRRSQREGNCLALLVLDIDHFKCLNDSHGHVVGDAVLRRLGTILTTFPNRAGDLAARLGGEEFVLLLPGANYQQALVVAERVRETIQSTNFDPPVHVSVTVSIGVASMEAGHDATAETLVSLADGALYEAKRSGRNRVVAA